MLLSISAQVFPNPATDHLVLEGLLNRVAYRFFRTDGIRVKEGESHGSIDVSDLPPGLYFLQILDLETNTFRTFRVQKN